MKLGENTFGLHSRMAGKVPIQWGIFCSTIDDPQCILTGSTVEAVKASVADPKAQHQGDNLWTLCVKAHVQTQRLHKSITPVFEMSFRDSVFIYFPPFFLLFSVCFKFFLESLHSKLPYYTWHWTHSAVRVTPSPSRESIYSHAFIYKCFFLCFAELYREWQRAGKQH